MLRTLTFVMEIFLGLQLFLPVQNGQNTCKNFQTKKILENAQNIDICHGNFWGLQSFSPIQNGQNTWKNF